ncbi:Nuclear body protein SP140 [Tupaia chinensis]|uniref:Nuclear body protein SP140 n=1 Tax=Tupaia chinensis TaxID=246437 RepID=L9L8K1_TUPCH|nr:Nuclear body protein SP140 [Tupaia chinensis]
MTSEDQNQEDLIFKYFKENKVEIASVIKTPFPFLMSLRDHSFISQKMFEHYEKACSLVPVPRVAYDVLGELEKSFSLSLLETLFSKANCRSYQGLEEIHKSFLNELASWRSLDRVRAPEGNFGDGEGGESEDEITEAKADKQKWEKQIKSEHSIEQRGVKLKNLSRSRDENGEKRIWEEKNERKINTKEWGKLGQEDSNVCHETCDVEVPQEALSSPPRSGSEICDPQTPQVTNGGEPAGVLRLLSGEGREDRNDCLEISQTEESQQASSSQLILEPVSSQLEGHQMNEEELEELASSLLLHDRQGNDELKNSESRNRVLIKRNRQERTERGYREEESNKGRSK